MGKKGEEDRGREGNRQYDKSEKTDLKEPMTTPKDFCFLFQSSINRMVKKGKKNNKRKKNTKSENFYIALGFQIHTLGQHFAFLFNLFSILILKEV